MEAEEDRVKNEKRMWCDSRNRRLEGGCDKEQRWPLAASKITNVEVMNHCGLRNAIIEGGS
jgi:hypothetical protein